MNINVNRNSFWQDYVTTAQLDAGEYLKATPNVARVEEAKNSAWINNRPVVLNYYDNSWKWGSTTHVVNNYISASTPRSTKQTEQEKKEKQADTAKIVGSIITIAGAFLVGYLYNSFSRYNTTYQNTVVVDKKLKSTGEQTCQNEVFGKLDRLVANQLVIDGLNAGRVKNYALAAAGLTAGGIAMAVGGFTVVPAYIVAGQIATVASAAFAALNCGLHWNDAADIKKAYTKIIVLADEILKDLSLLPSDLSTSTPQQAANIYPPYVPLYGDLSRFMRAPSAPMYAPSAPIYAPSAPY